MVSLPVREMAAAIRVLGRNELSRFASQGTSETAAFERELAAKFGVEHALAVNSGTSALICALVGLGIGPGDEVLVPAYTWVSTAAAPLAVGAVPVLVEIDESLTIDPADIERKITFRTKAIIPVHMLNLVCNMDAIMDIARRHNLFVIEDACQAFGLDYRGRRLGSIGHAGAFSFNQHKNIRSGEGGAVVTKDADVFARASMYHDVGSYERAGQVLDGDMLFVGVNFRMPELCAAILRPQLRRLDSQLEKRRSRRGKLVSQLGLDGSARVKVSPHHDAANAAGLTLLFSDAECATEFGTLSGASRLIETGRHVYTNWQSVRARRTSHPALNPYQWVDRDVDYSESTCPRTLDILARTCSIGLAPDIPSPVYNRYIKKMTRSGALRGAIADRVTSVEG